MVTADKKNIVQPIFDMNSQIVVFDSVSIKVIWYPNEIL